METLANGSNKVTKSRLTKYLSESFKVKPGFEAYGKKVHAYITTPGGMTRAAFEAVLTGAGCKVARDYNPGGRTVEVTNVSYFKADGWDE